MSVDGRCVRESDGCDTYDEKSGGGMGFSKRKLIFVTLGGLCRPW